MGPWLWYYNVEVIVQYLHREIILNVNSMILLKKMVFLKSNITLIPLSEAFEWSETLYALECFAIAVFTHYFRSYACNFQIVRSSHPTLWGSHMSQRDLKHRFSTIIKSKSIVFSFIISMLAPRACTQCNTWDNGVGSL